MRSIGRSLCVLGLVTSALAFAGQSTPEKQIKVDAVRKLLTEFAFFQPDDLRELDAGKVVVKAIPTKDKQVVSVVGAVRLNDISAVSMDAFRASLTQRNNKEMKASGKFRLPPTIDDLNDLELEEKDYKVLKKCSIGDCDMNMSAEMIRKFSSEVDWNADDHKERASALFREMLLRYVNNYAVSGDSQLGLYANRKEVVDLSDAHRSLVTNSIFLNDISPEIYQYFAEYPKKQLAAASSDMLWSTVDFGLKPAITLTHTVAFDGTQNGQRRFIVANKQIYASRYLDASLSFTILVGNGTKETGGYLIFADRSQSDALDGMLSGLARGVVEKEAIEKVKLMLQNAELRLIEAGKGRKDESTIETGGTFGFLSSPMFIAVIVAILGAMLFVILRRRRM